MPKRKTVDPDALLDQHGNEIGRGHDIRSIGPSDSSDSGSDMMGIGGLDSTGDRNGTGERGSVEGDLDLDDTVEISADDIVNAEEAGLGGGLDQAEEAQLGVTDEEIEDALDDPLGRKR